MLPPDPRFCRLYSVTFSSSPYTASGIDNGPLLVLAKLYNKTDVFNLVSWTMRHGIKGC
jgi:hypothetical protein